MWLPKGQWREDETLFEGFCRVQGKNPEDFLTPAFDHFHSPFEFADMQKAVAIIKNAIAEKKRIMIFGDYDVDGISGTAQLYLTLKMLGAEVSYRLPCRADGYGLSKHFIDEAYQNNVAVFITTDCGISNISEITKAKSLGMQVIITDHHSVPDHLPPADAILHPLVLGEVFSDKHLTGSGVAWYLCRALFETIHPPHAENLSAELLELAVLGTVADCGLMIGQNRIITTLGLLQLANTKNEGLKTLMDLSKTDSKNLSPESIGFYLAPRINASGRLAHPRIALELLLGNAERAKELDALNTARQQILEECLTEAEMQIENQQNEIALFVGASHWQSGIVGLIAGRLAEKFARPVIAWEFGKEKYTGSCRGPADFHISNTLKKIRHDHPEIFLGCGGHAQAAGLSIYPEHYERFAKLYCEEVKKERGSEPKPPEKHYYFSITKAIPIAEVKELWNKAQPFGMGNELPIFKWEGFSILTIKTVGADQKHCSLFLKSPFAEDPFSAIYFRGAEECKGLKPGDQVSVFATPEVREWNGKESIGLKVVCVEKNL